MLQGIGLYPIEQLLYFILSEQLLQSHVVSAFMIEE